MRAIQQTHYSKEKLDLQLVDCEKPSITDQEVLVKVMAAGVNPLDYKLLEGAIKLLFPYPMPFIAGNEFAGVVEAVGSQVSDFVLGQKVYARMNLKSPGAFAEYVAISASDLAPMPEGLSFEEAASVPLTALTAYQALDALQVEAGKTIFISGGSGGFGAMAIPLAKARGLKVITSGSEKNRQRVLALGADRYFDYKQEDYSQALSDVDYVIDSVGGDELLKQFSILKEGGALASLNGLPNKAFADKLGIKGLKRFLIGLAGRRYDRLAQRRKQTYHFIFVESNGAQLREITKLFEAGKLETSIDTVYNFEAVNQALDKVKTGHAKGKTILRLTAD